MLQTLCCSRPRCTRPINRPPRRVGACRLAPGLAPCQAPCLVKDGSARHSPACGGLARGRVHPLSVLQFWGWLVTHVRPPDRVELLVLFVHPKSCCYPPAANIGPRRGAVCLSVTLRSSYSGSSVVQRCCLKAWIWAVPGRRSRVPKAQIPK